jgi:hypothetical protein
VWEPKTDTVSYQGTDKDGKPVKVTCKCDELSSQSDAVKNEIDPAFVNDHYILLFPLHVAWDGWATVTDEGVHEMPISKKPARRIVVKYPADAGYSPGDTGSSTSAKTSDSRSSSSTGPEPGSPKSIPALGKGMKRLAHCSFQPITRGR